MEELTRGDFGWITGFVIMMVLGIIGIWKADLSNSELHFRAIYSLFLLMVAFGSIYIYLFVLGSKKKGDKK